MAKTQLSNIAFLALRGLDKEAKARIAQTAGVSIYTLYRWINSRSLDLTRIDTLAAIKKETGLTDSEVVETVPVKVSA